MSSSSFQLIHGDCLDVMATMEPDSIDAIVTDPPYGLSFMGKEWDHGVPGVPFWEAALRVLKPGGHMIAFSGSRTYHRLACWVEDAGFEIRDQILWVYGSGFPKSMDISKAIDKAAGAEREVVGPGRWNNVKGSNQAQADCLIRPGGKHDETAPATPDAQQWRGRGTALKPAHEPAVLARKPFNGTVAANVLQHGTGGINVDGCRIATDERIAAHYGTGGGAGHTTGKFNQPYQRGDAGAENTHNLGRWPANLIHDGSDDVVALFPQAGGGTAARFFYTAKTSRSERGKGNNHPTVKPLDLMAYLCRLVTPPGGIVLDPFCGSGTTLKAAVGEGFRAIGIELDDEYIKIAENRMNGAQLGIDLTALAS